MLFLHNLLSSYSVYFMPMRKIQTTALVSISCILSLMLTACSSGDKADDNGHSDPNSVNYIDPNVDKSSADYVDCFEAGLKMASEVNPEDIKAWDNLRDDQMIASMASGEEFDIDTCEAGYEGARLESLK